MTRNCFRLGPWTCTLLTAAAILGGFLATSYWLNDVPETPQAATTSAAMYRRFVYPQFENMPLADAIATLREHSGISIDVDWKRLEPQGVLPATTISTTQPSGRRLYQILTRVLDAATPAAGSAAVWGIDGSGRIIVTDELPMLWRSYDCRDLIGGYDLPQARVIQRLTDMFTLQVGSWGSDGGRGTMSFRDGVLVVYQTHDRHREIARLLYQMRQARSDFDWYLRDP